MKKTWKVIVKDENGEVFESFSVKADNNLIALLNAEDLFLSNHKEYRWIDCGMWIGDDTCQRDLTVEYGVMNLERYFSIELQ